MENSIKDDNPWSNELLKKDKKIIININLGINKIIKKINKVLESAPWNFRKKKVKK